MASKRVISFLSQGSQTIFLPGDPGEDEYDALNPDWVPEEEPEPCPIDLWTRKGIQTKPLSK
jgi:hypothetical protein